MSSMLHNSMFKKHIATMKKTDGAARPSYIDYCVSNDYTSLPAKFNQ